MTGDEPEDPQWVNRLGLAGWLRQKSVYMGHIAPPMAGGPELLVVVLDPDKFYAAVEALVRGNVRNALQQREDLLEAAWGLIANAGWDAGSGRTDLAKSPGWHDAAVRWRTEYFEQFEAPSDREENPDATS